MTQAITALAVSFVLTLVIGKFLIPELRKLKAGQRIYWDKQITQLKNVLGEANPLRLTLPEQGSFNLGYYHQKQAIYTKKEEQ